MTPTKTQRANAAILRAVAREVEAGRLVLSITGKNVKVWSEAEDGYLKAMPPQYFYCLEFHANSPVACLEGKESQ